VWRQPITTSFLRGARLGAIVASVTLVLSVFGAIAVLMIETQGASADAVVASDAPSVPGTPTERSVRSKRVPVEIDRALLEAAVDLHPSAVGDLLFQLSREAAAAAETAVPTAPLAAAEVAAPALPPRIIPGDELFAAIAEAFPEAPEFAYSVAMCESAGNATVNSGNGYYGLWQFDLATWRSVGGSDLPSSASLDEQIMRARMLYDARGWQPWGCARH